MISSFLHVQNDWDGQVDWLEVMVPCCLISEEGVAAVIKGINMENRWSYCYMNEMMKASGGVGTGWMTDLIKKLSKKAVFQMIGERVSWCMCAVHTELLSYWSSR